MSTSVGSLSIPMPHGWARPVHDGMVYDPKGQPVFGLVEVKCPNVASYVDCPYIVIRDGTPSLRKIHPKFWQIQGQMLISGCDWCDFVVYTQECVLRNNYL